MNQQPEMDTSEEVLVCVMPGKGFLKEGADGQSTWIEWVASPLGAKIFWPIYSYGERSGRELMKPLREPEYYQKWPAIPPGAKMALVRINTSVWLKEEGPPQPTPDTAEEMMVKLWKGLL